MTDEERKDLIAASEYQTNALLVIIATVRVSAYLNRLWGIAVGIVLASAAVTVGPLATAVLILVAVLIFAWLLVLRAKRTIGGTVQAANGAWSTQKTVYGHYLRQNLSDEDFRSLATLRQEAEDREFAQFPFLQKAIHRRSLIGLSYGSFKRQSVRDLSRAYGRPVGVGLDERLWTAISLKQTQQD